MKYFKDKKLNLCRRKRVIRFGKS